MPAPKVASLATLNETLAEYVFSVIPANDDHDGDGLPNWWESLYFGQATHVVAAAHADADPLSNLQEYIAGTDPTNAASCFRITNGMRLGDDFLIEWPSVSGRVYSALWSTNLTDGFLPLESGIPYPINRCTDTVHSAFSNCFYRLQVELP